MMGILEDSNDLNFETSMHAALTYEYILSTGPPARPLEFPTPTVNRGARFSEAAYDHRTGKLHEVKNILIRVQDGSSGQPPNRAYLMRKQVAKSIYGVVFLCVVMKRRRLPPPTSINKHARNQKTRAGKVLRDEDVQWESTEELAAVKVSSWTKIRQLRGRHLEDPIREIGAIQLLGNYHPNVVGTFEALQDNSYLYVVMPYCSGGDLFGRIIGTGRRIKSTLSLENQFYQCELGHPVDEDQAKYWFRQLLSGLFHLQKKGMCHRDISLDNIMVDESDKLSIVDMGLSLRVPYTDPSNLGCVTDVSAGTARRLMIAQGQGGKLMYLAPEIIARDKAFDGFSIDIWAAGVVLFIVLVGRAPFKMAHDADKRYAKIDKGNLKGMLSNFDISISEDACDLLQNMFWRDPKKRLTLAQIMQHRWVLDKQSKSPNVSDTKSMRFHTPMILPQNQCVDRT